MIRNAATSWGTLVKFFHWLVAALLLLQIVLGWSAVMWHLSPLKLNLFVWHKSIGMLILALAALRMLWRLFDRAPAFPSSTRVWERRAAHTCHLLLYGLLVAMPVTGWIVNSAANVPFKIFWLLPLHALVDPDKATEDLAARGHLVLFGILMVVLLIHISAALRHHFVLRDDVLTRMLPGSRGRA